MLSVLLPRVSLSFVGVSVSCDTVAPVCCSCARLMKHHSACLVQCVLVSVCHTFACSCWFVWNASMQVEVGSIRSSVGVLLHVSSLPSVATTNKHGSWRSSAASRVGFRFAFALLLLPVIAFFVHVAARSPDGGRPTHAAIRKECKQSDAFPRTRSVQCRLPPFCSVSL